MQQRESRASAQASEEGRPCLLRSQDCLPAALASPLAWQASEAGSPWEALTLELDSEVLRDNRELTSGPWFLRGQPLGLFPLGAFRAQTLTPPLRRRCRRHDDYFRVGTTTPFPKVIEEASRSPALVAAANSTRL
jgi:hypothetical protein